MQIWNYCSSTGKVHAKALQTLQGQLPSAILHWSSDATNALPKGGAELINMTTILEEGACCHQAHSSDMPLLLGTGRHPMREW